MAWMRYSELTEGKTFELPSQNGEIRVWENPGETALGTLHHRFGALRGFTLPDGTFWVWQANAATHQGVKQPNGLETDAHFYISGKQPADGSWTLGTWAYRNKAGDLTMWIDRNTVPARLRTIFDGPASFTPWQQ